MMQLSGGNKFFMQGIHLGWKYPLYFLKFLYICSQFNYNYKLQ